MRRAPRRTTTVIAALTASVLGAACSAASDDQAEVEVTPPESSAPDDTTADDGTADDAAVDGIAEDGTTDDGTADDGPDDATDDGGLDDAGERPEEDLALVEQQRDEFLRGQAGRSQMTSTGRIGSTTDRVGELESAYDAVETEEQETQLTVPDHVLFDFDSAELRPEAAEVLGEIAEVIEHYGTAAVEIRGHTDDIGSDAYNQELSERRAAAVVAHLVERAGVDADRLTATGAGSQEPVAPNANPDGSDDPEGRAQNRRVEIVIDG